MKSSESPASAWPFRAIEASEHNSIRGIALLVPPAQNSPAIGFAIREVLKNAGHARSTTRYVSLAERCPLSLQQHASDGTVTRPKRIPL